MHDPAHPRFGALRSLLQQPPSQTLWDALLAELEAWSGDALEALALPYVRAHLRHWPDTIERRPDWTAQRRWMETGALGASLLLANHMQLDRADHIARLASSPLTAHITQLTIPTLTHNMVPHLNALAALRHLHIEQVGQTREPLAHLANPQLRALSLKVEDDTIAALLRSSQLKTLEHLTLLSEHTGVSEIGVAALLSSPHAARLTTLALQKICVDHRAAAKLQSLPARLTTLHLRNASLTDAGLLALLAAPALDTLTSLSLAGNPLTPVAIRALAACPRLSKLETLDLTGAKAMHALPELLDSPHMRALRTLSFQGHLTAPIARSIAQLDWPPHLAMPLDSDYTNRMPDLPWSMSIEACEALARCHHLTRLTSLQVMITPRSSPHGASHRQIRPLASAAMAALLRSPHITELRRLRLWQTHDPHAERLIDAFATAPLTALEQLHITPRHKDHPVNDLWLRAIAANTQLRQLRELELYEVSDDALRVLASAPHLANLTDLSLCGKKTQHAPDTLPMLITKLPGLRHLDICYEMGRDAAEALARCEAAAKLEILEVDVVDGEAAASLLSSPHLQDLQGIHINHLGDAGCDALARTPLITRWLDWHGRQNSKSIYLEDCEITPRGLATLLSSPHLPPTFWLDLRNNPLGDEGAAVLAAHPTFARIERLNFMVRDLTKAGLKTLADSPHIRNLRFIRLWIWAPVDAEERAILLASPYIHDELRTWLEAME